MSHNDILSKRKGIGSNCDGLSGGVDGDGGIWTECVWRR